MEFWNGCGFCGGEFVGLLVLVLELVLELVDSHENNLRALGVEFEVGLELLYSK